MMSAAELTRRRKTYKFDFEAAEGATTARLLKRTLEELLEKHHGAVLEKELCIEMMLNDPKRNILGSSRMVLKYVVCIRRTPFKWVTDY